MAERKERQRMVQPLLLIKVDKDGFLGRMSKWVRG